MADTFQGNVLVEVHGLPDNKVEAFTYRAPFEVTEGEQVLVPAPLWSIRVTGRAELPGFVLGSSTEVLPADKVRDLIPEPAVQATAPVAALRSLLATWQAEAQNYESRAFDAYELARRYESKAEEIAHRIAEVKKVVGS
jgi:hypothetical protein